MLLKRSRQQIVSSRREKIKFTTKVNTTRIKQDSALINYDKKRKTRIMQTCFHFPALANRKYLWTQIATLNSPSEYLAPLIAAHPLILETRLRYILEIFSTVSHDQVMKASLNRHWIFTHFPLSLPPVRSRKNQEHRLGRERKSCWRKDNFSYWFSSREISRETHK